MKRTIQIAILITMFMFAKKVNSQCLVDAGPNKTFCCSGQSDTIHATFKDTICSCINYSYVWTPSTGLSNPNVLNPVVTPTATRYYKLCVTAYKNKGCFTICCQSCDSVLVTLNNTCCKLTGISENVAISGQIKIYPNPAKNFISVETQNTLQNGEIVLYDINGKMIVRKTGVSEKGKYDLNVTNFARGIYFVKVFENNNILQSTRIVLE